MLVLMALSVNQAGWADGTPTFNPVVPKQAIPAVTFTPHTPVITAPMVNELESHAAAMASYFPVFSNTDIQNSPSFKPSNTVRLDKWKAVYSADYAEVAHVDLPTGLRIVSDVRPPQTDAE